MKSKEPAGVPELYNTYLRSFVLAKMGRELPNTTFLYRQDRPLTQPEFVAIAIGAEDGGGAHALRAQVELIARVDAMLAPVERVNEQKAVALVA